MAERSCATCHNFFPVDGSTGGECRHAPPDPARSSRWPLVSAVSWCGQWRPLPVVQATPPCARCAHLQGLCDSLTARVAGQAELLARRTEKETTP